MVTIYIDEDKVLEFIKAAVNHKFEITRSLKGVAEAVLTTSDKTHAVIIDSDYERSTQWGTFYASLPLIPMPAYTDTQGAAMETASKESMEHAIAMVKKYFFKEGRSYYITSFDYDGDWMGKEFVLDGVKANYREYLESIGIEVYA